MKFLVGEQVYLRPVEKDDLQLVRKWVNDPETRGLVGQARPETQVLAEEWFEKLQKDESRVWFVIVQKSDDRVVGEAGLLRMFHDWRTTDMTIIIGEKDVWRKGYGKEVAKLVMDYAFGYLNFHRISIGVVGFNKRALSFWESVGFKQEGIQRDGYYYNHKYYNFVMMSILEDEFRAMYNV